MTSITSLRELRNAVQFKEGVFCVLLYNYVTRRNTSVGCYTQRKPREYNIQLRNGDAVLRVMSMAKYSNDNKHLLAPSSSTTIFMSMLLLFFLGTYVRCDTKCYNMNIQNRYMVSVTGEYTLLINKQ